MGARGGAPPASLEHHHTSGVQPDIWPFRTLTCSFAMLLISRELCSTHGVAMPSIPAPADDGTYEGFGPFKDLYLAAVDALRTREDLARVVREVVEDAQKDGARWLELHFYPGFESYRQRIGSKEEVWEVARLSAAAAGVDCGVGVGFIAATERWLPVSDAVDTAQIAVRLSKLTHSASGEPLAPIVAVGLQVSRHWVCCECVHSITAFTRSPTYLYTSDSAALVSHANHACPWARGQRRASRQSLSMRHSLLPEKGDSCPYLMQVRRSCPCSIGTSVDVM